MFAAFGLLLGGLDDLLVDVIWIGRSIVRRFNGRRAAPLTIGTLPVPHSPGRLAIFVAAWQEAGVIAGMLGNAIAVTGH